MDFYRFQVLTPSIVEIELTSDLLKPQDFDSYLQLFDRSGNKLAVNDNIAPDNTFSQIRVPLNPDTYYVGVSGNGNDSYDPQIAGSGIAADTGNYTLEFSYTSSDDVLIDITDLNFNQDNDDDQQVHRFLNLDTGIHFYTASAAERDLVSNTLDNYRYEGAFFGEGIPTVPGAKPVHRFLNVNTGGYLYTLSEIERDLVRDRLTHFNYEGVAFYGYEREQAGTMPLYRFYNPLTDAHFYTVSVAEKDAILANLPHYQLESQNGIAFYVEPLAIS